MSVDVASNARASTLPETVAERAGSVGTDRVAQFVAQSAPHVAVGRRDRVLGGAAVVRDVDAGRHVRRHDRQRDAICSTVICSCSGAVISTTRASRTRSTTLPRAVATVRSVPGVVAATPRIAAFVLVSGNDRSYGAQLLGVDPAGERALSSLPNHGRRGALHRRAAPRRMRGECLRVISVSSVGDQIVVLGSAADGGVAALAVTLVGTFDSGTAELDRQLLEIPLPSSRRHSRCTTPCMPSSCAPNRLPARSRVARGVAQRTCRQTEVGARMAGAASRSSTGNPLDRAFGERDVRRAGRCGHDRRAERFPDDGVRAHARVRHAAGDRHASRAASSACCRSEARCCRVSVAR